MSADESPRSREAHRDSAADRRLERPLLVITTLVVISTVSWRQGVFFSGALDPVVLLKGLLASLALALAIVAAQSRRSDFVLGARTVSLLALYLVLTVVGGWASGTGIASGIVAVRVAIVLSTLTLMLLAFGVPAVMRSIVTVMGAVAGVAVITGLPSLSTGRLRGGIPPLTPNEIAFLLGAVVLYRLHKVVVRESRWFDWPFILALLGVIWVTGSRTGIAALLVAMVVMLAQARVLSVAEFCSLVAALPVVAYVVLATPLVTGMLTRGGDANVTTLSSRTIAWTAALTMDVEWWQHWLGGGLSMKHIPVSGQYWQTQLLDSSWVSALVQGGYLGLGVVAVLAVGTALGVVRCRSILRPLYSGIITFVLLRSFLESGLFDVSTQFILFVVVSMAVDRANRRVDGLAEVSSAPPGPTGRSRALPARV